MASRLNLSMELGISLSVTELKKILSLSLSVSLRRFDFIDARQEVATAAAAAFGQSVNGTWRPLIDRKERVSVRHSRSA